MERFRAYIKLIRVYQWTKSGFIILPFLFSTKLPEAVASPLGPGALYNYWHLILAFFGFSFLASSIYVINDYRDRLEDRNDPRKRHRPIASGRVSSLEALGLILFLFVAGIVSGVFLPGQVLFLFIVYYLLNLFYNWIGKRVILLDVFIISVGYVLRVMVGAFALSVEASPWMLSTTFFLALFLGFFKRYYEVLTGEEEVLIGGVYRSETLRQFTSIAAALSILNYSIYCIQGPHANSQLIWTIPLVVLGIFRYYVLLQEPEKLKDGNPSDLLLADRFLIIVGFVWIFLSAVLLLNPGRLIFPAFFYPG